MSRISLGALGAVQILRDGVPVELAGRRPQLILALLLARGGQPVALAELIDLLWSEQPPAKAVNMVNRYVGMIRRAFEPGLPFRAQGRWLAGAPGGYLLRVAPAESDVLRFREIADRAAATEDPREAVPLWVAALSLWRGPYAEGLASPGRPPAALAALDRERAAAALAAATAARSAGSGAVVLPLVQAVAEQNPLDETLAGAMMSLLAAEDRQSDAVAWFRRTSQSLADQLGVSPGPGLQKIFDGLSPPAPPDRVRAPAQLPNDLWLFTGRRAELDELNAARRRFTGVGVIAIDGLPGVGKSALALRWAHTVAGRFPDGQLFVNLRGYEPTGPPADPADVLAQFLDALGVPSSEVPADPQARAGLFRTVTAARRMLVVLDNARDAQQVRPLIPASPGSLVLVTSRTRLAALAAQEGAALAALGLPGPAEARDQFRHRLTNTPLAFSDTELDEIAELCGRLPLAIAIVAARSAGRSGTARDLLAELRESRDSLDAFDDDSLSGVRPVFSWSYHQLSTGAARLFRLMATHPGPDITGAMLASLAGRPRAETTRLLRELTRTRLVSETVTGRYTQHDLVAVYAAELAADLDPPAETEAAADRLLDHFTRTIQRLNEGHLRVNFPTLEGGPLTGVTPEVFAERTPALRWLRTEAENLTAVLHDAYRRGRHPWRTVADWYPAALQVAMLPQWAVAARPALEDAIAAGDRRAEGRLRRQLSEIVRLTDPEAARAAHRRSLQIFEELGDPVEQALAHIELAGVSAPEPGGPAIARHFEQAVALFQSAGHAPGKLVALRGLGRHLLELGRREEGVAMLTEGLAICLDDGDFNRAAAIFWHLGVASGRPDAADLLLLSQRLYQEAGNRYWSVIAGLQLAEAYLAAGRRHDATAVWQRAAGSYRELTAEGALLDDETRELYDRVATAVAAE